MKILKQTGQHTEESVAERLSRPIGTVKQKTLETIEQPTFQPTIAKKSREIVESSTKTFLPEPSSPGGYRKFSEIYYTDEENDLYEVPNNQTFTLDPNYGHGRTDLSALKGPSNVYLRNQRWQQEREDRMKREKVLREQQELNECSFRPKIKEPQRGDGWDSSSASQVDGPSTKSMAERQAEWQRRRDEKIERERREKELKDLAECSFTPSLGRNTEPQTLKQKKTENRSKVSFCYSSFLELHLKIVHLVKSQRLDLEIMDHNHQYLRLNNAHTILVIQMNISPPMWMKSPMGTTIRNQKNIIGMTMMMR